MLKRIVEVMLRAGAIAAISSAAVANAAVAKQGDFDSKPNYHNDSIPMIDESRTVGAQGGIAAARSVEHTLTFVKAQIVGVTDDEMSKVDESLPEQVESSFEETSRFWNETTDGAIQITEYSVIDEWVKTDFECAESESLWNTASSEIGFGRALGEHLVVVVPNSNDGGISCGAVGYADMGVSHINHGAHVIVARETDNPVDHTTLIHELGHNFGLGHSGSAKCSDWYQPEAMYESGFVCGYDEYDDMLDVMGYASVEPEKPGTLSPRHLETLGVKQYEMPRITESTHFRVRGSDMSHDSSMQKYPVVVGDHNYYIEYRRHVTPNKWAMSHYDVPSGLIIRRSGGGDELNEKTSIILRSPREQHEYDYTVGVGETLNLPNVVIENVGQYPGYALMKVSINGIEPPPPGIPADKVSPATLSKVNEQSVAHTKKRESALGAPDGVGDDFGAQSKHANLFVRK